MSETLRDVEQTAFEVADALDRDHLSWVERRQLSQQLAHCFYDLQQVVSGVLGGFGLSEPFQKTRAAIHDTRNPRYLRTWVQHAFEIIDLVRVTAFNTDRDATEEEIQQYLVG